MFDSHCHLTNARFSEDRALVIERMRDAGIAGCLTIGTGLDDAAAASALTVAHPGTIWAAAGLDPFSAHAAGDAIAQHLVALDRLLDTRTYVAVGECGIECHHDLAPLPQQREHFAAQITLATRYDLPLVVHARSGMHGGDAHAIALDVLRAHPGVRGVIHSFDGNAEQAQAWLDTGFHVAVNGMLTFKGNDALRMAMRSVPADRLLIETDAPYLSPVPHRGKRCEPGFAAVTATTLADLRGERSEDVMAWAGRNARALFALNT